MKQKVLLKGIVACKGKVKAQVRIIKDPSKPPKNIGDKKILVIPFSSPLLTLIICKAKGLIVEKGGVNSHVSLIAREFGIPCIVGAKKATKTLKEGQVIVLDANKGVVYGKNNAN